MYQGFCISQIERGTILSRWKKELLTIAAIWEPKEKEEANKTPRLQTEDEGLTSLGLTPSMSKYRFILLTGGASALFQTIQMIHKIVNKIKLKLNKI